MILLRKGQPNPMNARCESKTLVGTKADRCVTGGHVPARDHLRHTRSLTPRTYVPPTKLAEDDPMFERRAHASETASSQFSREPCNNDQLRGTAASVTSRIRRSS